MKCYQVEIEGTPYTDEIFANKCDITVNGDLIFTDCLGNIITAYTAGHWVCVRKIET